MCLVLVAKSNRIFLSAKSVCLWRGGGGQGWDEIRRGEAAKGQRRAWMINSPEHTIYSSSSRSTGAGVGVVARTSWATGPWPTNLPALTHTACALLSLSCGDGRLASISVSNDMESNQNKVRVIVLARGKELAGSRHCHMPSISRFSRDTVVRLVGSRYMYFAAVACHGIHQLPWSNVEGSSAAQPLTVGSRCGHRLRPAQVWL